MVAEMRIAADGSLSRSRFYAGLMLSKARLTYTRVNDYLAGDSKAIPAHTHETINNLKSLYDVLLQAREKRGAIGFEMPEPKFEFDEDGRIDRVAVRERGTAERVIEECMLAANVCTAQFLKNNKAAVPFRNHEPPTEEKVTQLRQFLQGLGLQLGGGDSPRAADYNRVFDHRNMRESLMAAVQPMMLRSMKQARYGAENKGHFALDYDTYAHFTSPIRRYPDLIVHRQLRAVLDGDKPYNQAEVDMLAESSSNYERRADEATRDVWNRLKTEYMLQHLGDEFDGLISGVTNFGIFVQLKGLFVDGLIRVADLGDDWYDYDERHAALVGQRSGDRLAIGDDVRVKVVRVDVEEGRIDFVRSQPDDQPGKGKSGQKRSSQRKSRR
jgi:ribonuclease R